ncbi:transcription repressor NadR [Rubeoparvulum massiliense]|uniref:transcription repressor NadR n=1 Tax=Rubeoparvulum massiliense TaxID=1631346 RepID=UPI00065DC1CF|nr:transcription repressor NadR [Rubeoparvulum massiliense]
MTGDERRELLCTLLSNSPAPITGTELAETLQVSRQVIVSDIALLRAKDQPIISTPQGYQYLIPHEKVGVRKVIACQHSMQDAEEELTILVDHGVTVLDVIVEHPVYGELHGSLMVKTRWDVQQFLNQIKNNQAGLLSSLTNGIHLHTIEAEQMVQIEEACALLREKGILLMEEIED